MDPLSPALSFAEDEIASVESFRRLKDTAVLTIMFTDIEGFTALTDEKGERHSAEVRHPHDELLDAMITRGDAGIVRLTPLRSGDRVRSVPSAAWASGFVLLGVAATVGYLQFQRTDVYLTEYSIPLSYIDGTTEILLEGADTDSSRKLLVELQPGRHVLHYNVAEGVRFYAELDVERGENRLRPDWVESRLPSIYRFIGLGDEPVTASKSGSYFVYDTGNERIDHEANLVISIDVASDKGDPATLISTLSWGIALDGVALSDETRTFRTPVTSNEAMEEKIALFSDDFHRYWVKVRLVRHFAHLTVQSAFKSFEP